MLRTVEQQGTGCINVVGGRASASAPEHERRDDVARELDCPRCVSVPAEQVPQDPLPGSRRGAGRDRRAAQDGNRTTSAVCRSATVPAVSSR